MRNFDIALAGTPPHPDPLPAGAREQEGCSTKFLTPSPQRGEGRGEGALTASAALAILILTACAHPDLTSSLVCPADPAAGPPVTSSAYRDNSVADLRSLVADGDRTAARVLGERYQAGEGVPFDLKQAAAWYERAAFVPPTTSFVYMPGFGKTPGSVIPVTAGQTGPGDPVALGRLGLLYRDGRGVKADPARADALIACALARGATLGGDMAPGGWQSSFATSTNVIPAQAGTHLSIGAMTMKSLRALAHMPQTEGTPA